MYGKWAIYSTASCNSRGSKKMLVNAVVKMPWVAPHSLATARLASTMEGLTYRLSGSGECI